LDSEKKKDKSHIFLSINGSNRDTTGLIIIDISNIEHPEFPGKISTTGFAANVIVYTYMKIVSTFQIANT
jgi:hypothetical protein